MTTARRLVGAIALLAILFAPARLAADDHDARDISAAALAPTLTDVDLGRVEARTDAGVEDEAPMSPVPVTPATPTGLAPAAVVLLAALSLVPLHRRPLLTPLLRRGPPLLAR